MFDRSTPFGQRVARRLSEERIIWLTTVRADGTPQPSPVWFLWEEQTLLIYSRPNTQKLRNIQRSPKVALNFDGDKLGGDIIVFIGEAVLDPQAPPANLVPAYVEKYRPGFIRINTTPEGFAQTYSVALRVTLGDLRGH